MKQVIVLLILSALPALIGVQDHPFLNNPAYIVGRGEHSNYENARNLSLADLSSQIMVTVKWDMHDVKRETGVSLDQFTESVTRSYSSANLTGVQRCEERTPSGGWVIYSYIPVVDKNRLFDQRKAKIKDMVRTGIANDTVNNFDTALRNFYWALVLLQSHPDRDTISATVEGRNQLLSVYLPSKIQNMLKDVRLTMGNSTDDGTNALVYITAANSRCAINDLNLTYNDGCTTHLPARIKDGKGAIYIPKAYLGNISDIEADIDYQFTGMLGDYPADPEVKSLIGSVFIRFDSEKNIPVMHALPHAIEPVIQKAQHTGDRALVEMTSQLVSAIKSRNLASARNLFTPAGYTQFTKLMNCGTVALYEGTQREIKFVPFGERTLIRSIPLVIRLTDGSGKVIYDNIAPIVENGKIVWTNFAISDRDADDAIQRGTTTGDLSERLLCLTFMEYYKTLFAMKEADSIANIFSDDALIFVGYAKGSAPVPKELGEAVCRTVSMADFDMLQLSKEEYIWRLKNIAFRNPVVNIQFSELEIVRKPSPKPIFAIQLHQNYYSTGYADQGYLLLFTDNSDSTQPKIFFRCWQPKKFTDYSNFNFE